MSKGAGRAVFAAVFLSMLTSCASVDPVYWITGSTILSETFTYEAGGAEQEIDYSLLALLPEEKNETYPLVIVFHAKGSSSAVTVSDFEKPAREKRMLVLAPSINRHLQNRTKDLDPYFALIKDVQAAQPIQDGKPYLVGVSAGSVVARWMMLRHPESFQAVVLIATETYENWTASVDFEKYPPILFVHGGKDPHYPIEDIRKRVEIIRDQGGDVQLIEHSEAGHVYEYEWSPEILEWLQKTPGLGAD